jgi:hypothetical protein
MDATVLKWFILYSKPQLSNADVEHLIDAKRQFFGTLFNDEVLTELVAFEMGISFTLPLRNVTFSFSHLVDGVRDVNFTATVEFVSPTYEFDREDGTKGKVVRVGVANSTGHVNLVLWDDNADATLNLGCGDLIRVSHAYTKKSVYGEVELFLGKNGEVAVEKRKEER